MFISENTSTNYISTDVNKRKWEDLRQLFSYLLLIISHMLFKWVIDTRNYLSILSVIENSMETPGWLFGWAWSNSEKIFLTKQLEFYCFFTFIKWFSHQLSSHPTNQLLLLLFLLRNLKNLHIVNFSLVQMWSFI